MPYIGIDFGTSNSVVADFQFGHPQVLPNREGASATPSVVTLRRNGSVAVGHEAKETFDPERSIRSIKRVLGQPERVSLCGQVVRPEQIAVMLFSLLKRDAEAFLREPIDKAVITIPANSKGLARHATKLCAATAGFQVLTLINEPTAAAICYGLTASTEQNVLVYDFGGGTLDVTILRLHHGVFEEIGSKGIGKLGGDDIDELLAEHLGDRFYRQTGYDILRSPYRTAFLLAVERAKIDLSIAPSAIVRRAALVPEQQLSLEEPIERAELEQLIKPTVYRSGTAIDEALARAGLQPGDIDTVLLVGGTSKIPLIRHFVAEKIGTEPEPFSRADPLTCVAQGAAIVSAILQGAPGLDHYAYSVKLEHSLCTNPIDEHGRPYLDPIIKRGSDIPCTFTKTYYPVADPAERVSIPVFEGDVYDDPDALENVKLAEIAWEFDPPRPQKQAGLEVTYEYSDDGILTVSVHDLHARRRQRFAIQQVTDEALSPKQVEKLQSINEKLMAKTEQAESATAYRDALEALRRAEQGVLPKLTDAAMRLEIEGLCRSVRQAMGSGDTERLVSATDELGEQLLNHAHLL